MPGTGRSTSRSSCRPSSRPGASCGPTPSVLAANRLGQPGLWPHGISGDRPILLVHARRPEDLQLLREVLAAHAYWRRRSVSIDLVILDDGATVYEQPLRASLERESRGAAAASGATARAASSWCAPASSPRRIGPPRSRGRRGARRGARRPRRAAREPAPRRRPARLPAFVPIASTPLLPETTPPLERPDRPAVRQRPRRLHPDGREYVIHLEPGRATPAPWVNVVANPGSASSSRNREAATPGRRTPPSTA